MLNEFSRTELLLGEESMNKLRNSHVAVFGIGGVGSYIAEGLARCGVGKLTLIDNDEVVLTNLNRQIIALHSTIGMKKTDAAKKRILDINPNSEVYAVDCFYTGGEVELTEFDYIADAIDTVSSKLALIENAYRLGIPIISSMGTGNKLDPLRLTVTDIYETRVCPLAKVMRYELKKRNVKNGGGQSHPPFFFIVSSTLRFTSAAISVDFISLYSSYIIGSKKCTCTIIGAADPVSKDL